jgi:hypothetical protein
MPIQNPRTPYEHAYNEWSYGGGQQRGEPMPRARDFPSSDRRDPSASEYSEYQRRGDEPYASEYSEYQRRGDEPSGGRGAQGIWEGPQAPYQGGPPMDALGTYARTSPQPPITDWRLPTMPGPGERRYTEQEKRATQAQQGGTRYSGMGGEERRRLAESPAVVQRAREFERRRRQPQSSGTSLGALNRR